MKREAAALYAVQSTAVKLRKQHPKRIIQHCAALKALGSEKLVQKQCVLELE